jgi:hypothetical protein
MSAVKSRGFSVPGFRLSIMPPRNPDHEPIDIGHVWFGVRWIHARFEKSDVPGKIRLLTLDGTFEWRNRRYSFRWGAGLLSGFPEAFVNGIREWKPRSGAAK